MPTDLHATVAILLATYNGASYIEEFLDSLCEQSWRDFRVYVRDDGSTDGTLEILSRYTARLNIRVLPAGERLGPARSFFHIMAAAEEEHACYMLADQDDHWHPDKVARAASALKYRRDEIVLYCTRQEYVDAQRRPLGLSPLPRLLGFENATVENIAIGCTTAITHRMRREVLAPDPSGYIMHDWWLYLYASAFGEVLYDTAPSIQYRQHGSNTIGVPNGFIQDFQRRWKRFARRDGGIHRLSGQIQSFLRCYGPGLAPARREWLELLGTTTRSPLQRLRIALHPSVARQRHIDTLILRVLFLIGRY